VSVHVRPTGSWMRDYFGRARLATPSFATASLSGVSANDIRRFLWKCGWIHGARPRRIIHTWISGARERHMEQRPAAGRGARDPGARGCARAGTPQPPVERVQHRLLGDLGRLAAPPGSSMAPLPPTKSGPKRHGRMFRRTCVTRLRLSTWRTSSGIRMNHMWMPPPGWRTRPAPGARSRRPIRPQNRAQYELVRHL